MPQFKDRQEYEKWKAERQKQAAAKAQQERRPPEPLNRPPQRKIPDTAKAGLLPVGELFRVSWEIYQRRFGTLLPLYLISVMLLILPLALFLGGGYVLSRFFPDAKYVLIGTGGILGFLISFVTAFWGMAGLIVAVADTSLGVGIALGRAWPKVWSFIWLYSVLGFMITGGFLLFFIPGLLFLVWFSFAQFILAEDEGRGMNALLKSKGYVRGHGEDVFLRLFLIWILGTMLGIIPFIGPILSIAFFPFMLVYLHQIYTELKAAPHVPAFIPSAGEKVKWVLVSLLGYIVLPVVLIALIGAAFLGPLLALSAFLASPGTAPPFARQYEAADVIRPANFSDLLGTWVGREINREPGWTVTFSEGHQVKVVNPSGEWYRGKAAIHFDLGITDGAIRVPPGAGILDIDIMESSSGKYAGKISLGAYSLHDGTTLKLCGGEPGNTERPASLEPAAGMRCLELTRASGLSSGYEQHAPAVQVPGHQSAESDVAAAREAFKKCMAAFNAGNMDEAKKYVAKSALSEMEHSGIFSLALGMLSGVNIDEFVPSAEGDQITFRKSEKQGDMTTRMSVTMVKEDGKWKVGK